VNEHLKDRILRRLEALPDERGYQILDFVEFLESKYAERTTPDNFFTKITEKVEDTMRAGKLPVDAIAGTVGFFDGASKVMRGMAAAAQAAVDEASKTAQGLATKPPATVSDAPPPPVEPPAAGPTG
jgi:hypothetical protein